jgi:hypothetical protein
MVVDDKLQPEGKDGNASRQGGSRGVEEGGTNVREIVSSWVMVVCRVEELSTFGVLQEFYTENEINKGQRGFNMYVRRGLE